MFVDDLLKGSRKQVTAPLSDLLLFTRHWGSTRQMSRFQQPDLVGGASDGAGRPHLTY